MVKGVRLSSFEFSKPRLPAEIKPAAELLVSNCNNTNYESDDFRMYTFKIKRCNKTRSHDWTECPYLHRGEKARRRDPRKFSYCDIACPEFRRGGCPRGDSCEFSHGVFEFWLHPARYRTRPCTAGRCCRRKVCFFAHTPEQLRSGTGTEHCRDSAVHRICLERLENDDEFALVGDWDLGMMKMGAGESGDELDLTYLGDSPDIDWISELVS